MTMSAVTTEAPVGEPTLDALPVGQTFTLAGQPDAMWTKCDDGRWQREGFTPVPSAFFHSYVVAGRITFAGPPPVLAVDPARTADLTAEEFVAVQRVEVIPEDFKRQLRAYADEVEEDGLDDILNRFGFGIVRMENVSVNVVVTGYNLVSVSETQAAESIGIDRQYITDIEDSCTVRWRRRFTITREVTKGSCACDDVATDDADVDEFVPGDAEDVEFESTDCDND